MGGCSAEPATETKAGQAQEEAEKAKDEAEKAREEAERNKSEPEEQQEKTEESKAEGSEGSGPEGSKNSEGSGPQEGGGDRVGSYSHAGDSQFCSEHECIGDFTGEGGYVVECADGAFSHAGGISGACSHHGGEK